MSVSFPPPPPETREAILRLVVARYPEGGSQHERAIRLAIHLTWPIALATAATALETVNG